MLRLWKCNYLTFRENLLRNDIIQSTLLSVYPREKSKFVEHLYVTMYLTWEQRDDIQSLLLGVCVSSNIICMYIAAWTSKYAPML